MEMIRLRWEVLDETWPKIHRTLLRRMIHEFEMKPLPDDLYKRVRGYLKVDKDAAILPESVVTYIRHNLTNYDVIWHKYKDRYNQITYFSFKQSVVDQIALAYEEWQWRRGE